MDPNVYLAIAAILVVLGVLGTVLPVLPGALLVFGGLFLAAWAQDFTRVGLWGLALIGALLVLALAVDFFAVFFGLPGILLGPFIGAVVGELIARGGFAQAAKVGIGTWLGLVVAAVAKLVIAFLMIGIFAAFYAANS